LANPEENHDDAERETSAESDADGGGSAAETAAATGATSESSGEQGTEKAAGQGEASAKPLSPGARLAAQRAAKAAAKAAKRGKTQADEVEQQAEAHAATMASWFEDNRKTVYGVLAAIAVLLGVYVAWSTFGHRAAEQASAALGEALDVANARIRAADAPEEPADALGRETFPTTTARAEKALSLFRKVTSQHAGSDAALWARLGEARALLDLDKPGEARAAFEKALREGSGNASVTARAFEGIAFTFEAENQPQKAVEKFQALSRAGEGAFKDLADYHLARMYLRTGEENRAKDLLKDLVQRLRAGDDGAPEDRSPYILTQAEVRLAELDSSLVPRPTQGLNGGSLIGPGGIQLGGDGPSNVTPEQIQEILRNLQKSRGGAPPPGAPE
jgi:predicted negative regulator of RcsB-dependent stress response